MYSMERMSMNQRIVKVCGTLALGVCLTTAAVLTAPSMAQQKKVTQVAGVDNTPMGAYRALAQLSFQAFQKGDMATAAELARILERTWDGAEEGGGPRSLVVKNKDLFEQLDGAMDVFIKPVIHYSTKAPDTAAVRAAYDDFIEKLKKGD
jgi:hypothetical protein